MPPIDPKAADGQDPPIELAAHVVGYTDGWALEPASPRRAWMDATDGFAYRCLPLAIANQSGWVVRAPCDISARWNGEQPATGLEVRCSPAGTHHEQQIRSFFGWGILTFSVPWLFRTAPGYALVVRGAPNFCLPGLAPLEGIVETDWATSTFTMNWQVVDAHRDVGFSKGDPICFIRPYPLDLLERCRPMTLRLESNPTLMAEYQAWSDSRATFNKDPHRKREDWQKDYVRGETATGEQAREHRSRLNVRPFQDLT